SLCFVSPRPAPPVVSPLPLHAALPICPLHAPLLQLRAVRAVAGVAADGPVADEPPGDEQRRAARGRPADAAPAAARGGLRPGARSEEHTSELQSRENLVCRLLLEKKKQ